jgi:hypothetical protein
MARAWQRWHHLGGRGRPVLGERLPRWQGPLACGSRQVGFEAASILGTVISFEER